MDDPRAFQGRVPAHLLENEAHNCVILGVLSQSTEPLYHRSDEAPPLMALVEDGSGRTLLAATRTVPYPIVISPSMPEAVLALTDHLAQKKISLPGVTAEMATAQSFADAWAHHTGQRYRLDTRLGAYQITGPAPVPPVPGSFRPARTTDSDVLLPFATEFSREIREHFSDPAHILDLAIGEDRLFVWCDDSNRIVSMAAFAGPTPNGVRINFVFTPADQRGRGYASACVATLTNHLFRSGRKLVFLFTDLSNPTSNGIYQRLGYRYIGEQQKILFE